MRTFLLFLLAVGCSVVLAGSDDLQLEAVRAYNAGDYARAKSLFEVLAAENPRNIAARNYLRMIAQKMRTPGLELQLRKIIIPTVELQDVSAREAVAFLTQKVREISGETVSLNTVWMVPADDPAMVTLSLRNIPAGEALRYIADAANLDLKFDRNAVQIRSAKAAAPVPAQ